MGYMVYDSSTKVTFDDRVLAHLEAVIITKLRRKESFAVTWREAAENGDGRSTLWLDVAIPLRFRFDGSRSPSLERAWVERMAASAAAGSGLVVTDEDGQPARGFTEDRR
jgi:hypothetical protein